MGGCGVEWRELRVFHFETKTFFAYFVRECFFFLLLLLEKKNDEEVGGV